MSTSLTRLDARFRPLAQALIKVCRKLDPRFTITSARRTRAEQTRLYNLWLKGQNAFPAAAPGTSMHEKGLAVDMHRLNVDPQTDELLHAIGREWVSLGGKWGGATDPVHFQAPASLGKAARRSTPSRRGTRSSRRGSSGRSSRR